MSLYIGNILVVSVQEVTLTYSTNHEEAYLVDNDTNLLLSSSEAAPGITIDGTIVKHLHPDDLSVEEQREKILNIVETQAKDNSINYMGLEGHLSVESVSVPESGSQKNIRELTVGGRYLPWPRFFSGEPEPVTYEQRFGHGFGELFGRNFN